ncbi:chaplin [Embleya sp. NPDC050493]|uniref:chaplin n=1 Tax=Embleya sp. NPDC050493 TaxID=3363989 RepID=UPI0037A6A6DD
MNKLTKGAVVTAAILGGSVAMGGQAFASAEADGAAVDSPGVLSGNNIQVPVHIPVNVCGNSVNIIAALNPTFGNTCINAEGSDHVTPMPTGHPGNHTPPHHAPPVDDCPPPAPPVDDCPPELPPPPHHAPSDDCGPEQQSHHARGGDSAAPDFLAGAANMAGAMMG